MTERARILVVEDHAGIAQSLRANLEVEGHFVEVAANGEAAVASCMSWHPELVILDLMLPGIPGFDVLFTIRDRGFEAPVLILSALGGEAEKLRGFRLGADDYVTKPFGLRELLARVKVLLKRNLRARNPEAPPTTYRFGSIAIEVESRRVTKDGTEVELRPKEFDLLVALASRPGRVIPKRQLLREVWGYDPGVVSRTVDTHLLELRRRLEDDPAKPKHFKTRRGEGCVLTP